MAWTSNEHGCTGIGSAVCDYRIAVPVVMTGTSGQMPMSSAPLGAITRVRVVLVRDCAYDPSDSKQDRGNDRKHF